MFNIAIIPLITLCFSVIFLLIILFYYFYFFTQLKVSAEPKSESRPISVIVAARNEKKNLEQYLELLLNQEYPEYEVVVAVARDENSSGLLLVERSVSLGDDRLVGGDRTSTSLTAERKLGNPQNIFE